MRTLHLSRDEARSTVTQPTSTPEVAVRGMTSPLAWLAGGAAVLFLAPFVGTDVLGLQPDLYYLLYFTAVLAWVGAFTATHRSELSSLWRLNLRWSLVVGAVAGAGVAAIVFGSAGTDHPDGWRWAFEIVWRGVVYSAVDTVALFVFPAAVAYLLLHGDRTGGRRKTAYAGLVLALSLLMSTSYHLGYSEYRDADLRSPLIGTVMADSAAVLTGNPVGAFLTHGAAHVSAVVHQNEGGPTQMLPPKETADYPGRGDPDLAAGLAALWLLGAAATGITLVRRTRRGSAPATR